ncbi:hypothetical protein D3C72_1301730 [compost metagenome]
MRILVAGRGGQADLLQHLIDATAGLGGRGSLIQQMEVLGHQPRHGPAWIEAAVGVLEHHLNVAADGFQRRAPGRSDVAAPDQNPAGLRRFQRQHGAQQGGLAAAALADQADAFARLDRQADVVHGAEGVRLAEQTAGAGVFAHQTLDLKHRRGVVLDRGMARRGVGGVGQKPLRIGVGHAGEDAARVALLDQFAVLHHRHAVGGLGHHGEVVGDEDQTHAVLAHQPLQQLQNLGLGGDVQRRRRLIGDQQFGR